MVKGIYIDSSTQQVREIELADEEYERRHQVRSLVGGDWIDITWEWESCDAAWVDGNGLSKPQRHFFALEPKGDWPIPGSAVVLGPDQYDKAIPAGLSGLEHISLFDLDYPDPPS